MAKQLNVSLNFAANTQQAKAQMQELQRQLNALGTTANIPVGQRIKDDILGATKAAAELKTTLDGAVNANTGKLDLTKFSTGLKASGKDLKYYRENLQKLGPEGSQAFLNLATAIQNAEAPLIRTNSLLGEMWTTMKNTARWQFSSSVLHSIQGTFSAALGYVQDLNESLNDIRIVTGQSVEQMADFAKEANKAAKTLGTTTTRYTNAALIYYQQGLSDQEVQQRTDTTVKMANVTGENAEDVSSYMTAIWNNFDDGSKSLEYFADVITTLGAETAASSEEIANGLEKFAAIGSTIGLSYEYATAALTTIIDKTRQSEDVVGTALKTIFARIQGLKLGEETEDGLDLNKYSQALAQYGIQIFDANRNLKDMDEILDDMGEKWGTLNRAQKVGLAQTVAGVRQYNQLVSLMDNWDAMQQNLNRATSASGSLDAQAEIYAESWEAASNEVRASMEELYSSIIDDEFMIDMMHFGADAINTIDSVIDGLGGVKGMLLLISSIVTTKLGPQMAQGLTSLTMSIGDAFTNGKFSTKIRKDAAIEVSELSSTSGLTQQQVFYYQQIGELTDIYEQNVSNMSKLEKNVNLSLIERQKILQNNSIELEKQLKLQQEESENITSLNQKIFTKHNRGFEFLNNVNTSSIEEDLKAFRTVSKAINFEGPIEQTNELRDAMIHLQLEDSLLEDKTKLLMNAFESTIDPINDNIDGMQISANQRERLRSIIYQEVEALREESKTNILLEKNIKDVNIAKKNAEKTILSSAGAYQYWATTVVSAAQAVSSLGMVFNMWESVKDVWNDDSLTNQERTVSILTSMGTIIPILLNSFNGFKSTIEALIKTQIAYNIQNELLSISHTKNLLITIASIAENKKLEIERKKQILTRALCIAEINTETASKIANQIATEGLTKSTKKLIIQSMILKSSTLLLTGGFIAIVAVIGVLITLIDKATISQKELNKSFDEFEEASEKVKSLKDEIDGVNNSIDELLSKGLSQLTEEEEEQLSLLRQQRLELEGQLAIAERLQENEQREFVTDFKQFVDQGDFSSYKKETLTDSSTVGESSERNKAEKNLGLSGLSDINFYDTAAIDAYENQVKDLMRNGQINETNQDDYNKILDEIGRLRDLGADNAEQLQSDYEKAKIYLQSDDIDKESEYYTQATAAIAKYYDYLGDAINFKDNIIKQYEASEDELTRLQGALGEKENFSEEELEKILPTNFYEKLKQMSEETGTNLVYLADKLGLFSDSVNKLNQQDVFDNLRALLEGKTDSNGNTLSGVLESYSFSDGATSINLGTNNLQDILKQSGLSVQEQQDILLNIDWANQTQAKSVLQALQQIEELSSDNGMVQEAISLGYSEEQFEAMTAGIMRTNEAFKDNEQLAKQAAIYQMRLSKAIDAASEIWDDYGDALKEADENNSDYYEGLGALAEVFTENLGFEVDWSSIEENLDLVKKAMEGDADAASELSQQLAFDDIDTRLSEVSEEAFGNLSNVLQSAQSQMEGFAGYSAEFLEGSLDKVQNKWNETREYLDNNDLAIGEVVDDQYIQSLNEMIAAAGMTKEEAQNYLSSIGYEGELDTKEVTVPGHETSGEVVIAGILPIKYTYKQADQKMHVPFIKDATLTKSATKTGLKNVSSGSQSKSSSSGGSKKEMDRYHTVSNQLETLEDQYSAIGSAREQAFGADKLAFYDLEIEKLDQIITKNKEYLSQIEKNLASDKAKMESYGAKFDENGDITNYRTIFKKYGQNEEFQKALENYEDSVDKYRQKVEAINENLREWQSLNFERLNYVVELRLDVNADELQELDYYYNKISDDVYKSAESFALLKGKMSNTTESLKIHEDAVTELERAYQAGEISQADYIDGIREHKDAIYDNLEALQDYEEQLKEFYSETLEKAKDELAEYTDQFDHLSNALEHYKNILELTGQEQDFEKMGVVLKGQAEVTKDRAAVSKEWYETQKQNLADLEAEYARTHDETIKAALDAQRTATAEAYDQMLSDAEEYAKALTEIYQNEVAAAQSELEKALSGGLGFDKLNASMQHMSDIQDEYLTKTNQIYETNKLLNSLNNDINKTNNVASKQRLNAFAKEIEQLQEKDKLSNLELEIAQAKYKQLQAQIALEEAQNAKSVVRLSRDNEGNYGYIYTSDQEAISAAEQELADADNDLYNIRLKAANEYGEKIIQLNEELAQKLAEIDNNMNLTYEEKQAEKAIIMQQYQEKYNMYTDLYGIAQMEDARVVEDAWVNAYSDIILNGEGCKEAITAYNEETNKSFNNLQENLAQIIELAGTDLITLQNRVNDVTSASEALRTEINTQVIHALDTEIDKVKEQIIQHAKEAGGLKDLESRYEQLCKDLQTTIKKYSELETAALEAAAAIAKTTNAGNVSSSGISSGNKNDVEEETPIPPKKEKSLHKISMPETAYTQQVVQINDTRYAEFNLNGKKYYAAVDTLLEQGEFNKVNNSYRAKKGSKVFEYYDTGGYTGEWGPEGKLAMLHEKEIVLNKEDSANILKVVEIVRTMIDTNAAQAGLGMLQASTIADNKQTLEQTVTITAEFPNATDHNEIELAFDSLINRATQYANRK